MKKNFLLAVLLIFTTGLSSFAKNYLISPSATTSGAEISYKNRNFTVGTTAFPSFSAFVAANPAANSSVYVASGTYSENVTISTSGLTFYGANAFGDTRSSTRTLAESIIKGKITVNGNNTVINGFHFTGNGCVVNTAATTSNPLVGFKFIYNKVSGSTLAHDFNHGVVHLGSPKSGNDAMDASAHCKYQNVNVSNNEFIGSATYQAHFVVVSGSFGTCYYNGNTFNDGGCSIALYNAQGTNNIRYNVFKNVGDFTRVNGSGYGEIAIRLFYIAYANTTKINIEHNDFNNCQGQSTLYAPIRFFNGDTSNPQMTPVGCTIEIHHNIFRNKPKYSTANYNYVFYTNYTDAARVNARFNTYDNSELCFGMIKQKGETETHRLFGNSAMLFDHASSKGTTMDYYKWPTSSNEFKEMTTKATTVCQSYDIDDLSGSIYTCQIYTVGDDEHGLLITHFYYKDNTVKKTYMYLKHAGHGSNMAVCKLGGKMYIITGGKSIYSASSTGYYSARPQTVAFIPWVASATADCNNNSFTYDGTTYKILHWKNSLGTDGATLTSQYPSVDQTNRLFVEFTNKSKNTFAIYDLDAVYNYLSGSSTTKPDPLKFVKLTSKDATYKFSSTNSDYAAYVNADEGLFTWPHQGYTVSGDYIYIFEGVGDNHVETAGSTGATAVNKKPTIFVTAWNWRTDKFAYRKPILRSAVLSLNYGEPEGLKMHRDDKGRTHMITGVVTGASGARKYNLLDFCPESVNGISYSVPKGVSTPSKTSLSLTANSAPVTGTFNVTHGSNGGGTYGSLNGKASYVITGTDGQCFSVAFEDTGKFTGAFSTKVKVTITYTPDGTKRTHSAKLRISSANADDVIIPLTGTDNGYVNPDAPATLTASASSLSLTAEEKSSASKSMTFTGYKLTGNISLALSGANASLFHLSTSSLAAAGGSVTVTYSPTAPGSHSATLTATASGVNPVTVALNGTATAKPVTPVVDPTQFVFTEVNVNYNNIVASNDGRFSTGYGDYIYVTDKANALIYKYNLSGTRSTAFSGLTGIGTAISSDNAGNLLVNKDFSAATSANNWMIIEPNGTTHNLTLTYPSDVTAARIDAVGRAVGNMMSSAGAYVCITPNGNTKGAVFKIVNGAQSGNAIAVEMGLPNNATANTTTIAQPLVTTIQKVAADPSKAFAFRNRLNKNVVTKAISRTTSDGFDVFTLGDQTYVVEPTGASNYGDGYTIHLLGSEEIVAERAETVTNGTTKYQSLTARVSNDGTYAYIYQNVSGELTSIYRFGMPSTGVSAPISSAVTETGHVFYNLQGMRIDRPSAGQVLIRVATMSDGSIRTSKILAK